MGVISFAAFRPHAGRDADLLEVIGNRLPLLRRLGLATEREHIVVRTSSGIIMEVSEWASEEAVASAHKTPEVLAMWERFDGCSQYVTPNDANEFEKMFPTFQAVVAEPGVRLVAWGHRGRHEKGERAGGRADLPGALSGAVSELRHASERGTKRGRQGVIVGEGSHVLGGATAIGAALERDVYRVDLAAVVSNYIGETEKGISRTLQAAENAEAILLFDEADALFGKRTGVRDAHDRYANLDVSYLLQRLEQFQGVALIGVRRRESIDDAFTRRMRFVVEG
jgi:hypothetical protein